MNHSKLRTGLIISLIAIFSFTQLACSSDRAAAGTPAVSISAATIVEGNSGNRALVFTLSLSTNTTRSTSVSYTTSDVTTTAGTDYTAAAGTTVNITPGSNSAIIIVQVIGDNFIEDAETLTLTLSNPVGVTLANTTAIGTITNDDNGGYYTGSAAITSPALTINSPDLQAIFTHDEFILASRSNNLLYSGTITSRTDNDYVGTVRIYKNGVYLRNATVTGIQVSGTSATGTLSGAGDYTNATFAVDYSLLNTRAPLVIAGGAEWNDESPATASIEFTTSIAANVRLTANASSAALGLCTMPTAALSNVNTVQTGRIRAFSGVMSACTTTLTNGVTARGYTTSFDQAGADDVLLFVLFTDTDAQISILDCLEGFCPL